VSSFELRRKICFSGFNFTTAWVVCAAATINHKFIKRDCCNLVPRFLVTRLSNRLFYSTLMHVFSSPYL